MPGIVSYGAYVPPTRLGFSVLGGRPPKEGGPERAVAWRLELPPAEQRSLRDLDVGVWFDEEDVVIDSEYATGSGTAPRTSSSSTSTAS